MGISGTTVAPLCKLNGGCESSSLSENRADQSVLMAGNNYPEDNDISHLHRYGVLPQQPPTHDPVTSLSIQRFAGGTVVCFGVCLRDRYFNLARDIVCTHRAVDGVDGSHGWWLACSAHDLVTGILRGTHAKYVIRVCPRLL